MKLLVCTFLMGIIFNLSAQIRVMKTYEVKNIDLNINLDKEFLEEGFSKLISGSSAYNGHRVRFQLFSPKSTFEIFTQTSYLNLKPLQIHIDDKCVGGLNIIARSTEKKELLVVFFLGSIPYPDNPTYIKELTSTEFTACSNKMKLHLQSNIPVVHSFDLVVRYPSGKNLQKITPTHFLTVPIVKESMPSDW